MSHVPVLREEVVRELGVESSGRYLDCTFGGGGHTLAILEASAGAQVEAVDRDLRAAQRAAHLPHRERFTLHHASFSTIPQVIPPQRQFDGALADLGLSTFQLFESRGFSFHDEALLDMRMDESQSLTAAEVVNNTSERELYEVLRRGGVGPEARMITRAIVRARPLVTAKDLAAIVERAMPRKLVATSTTHPATVVFQALRIEVNQELQEIEALLELLPRYVRQGGRALLITFHSLEDKLVTRTMRQWEGGEDFSASFPGSGGQRRSIGRLVHRKPIRPSASEIEDNPSSRSARLRVFEFTE